MHYLQTFELIYSALQALVSQSPRDYQHFFQFSITILVTSDTTSCTYSLKTKEKVVDKLHTTNIYNIFLLITLVCLMSLRSNLPTMTVPSWPNLGLL